MLKHKVDGVGSLFLFRRMGWQFWGLTFGEILEDFFNVSLVSKMDSVRKIVLNIKSLVQSVSPHIFCAINIQNLVLRSPTFWPELGFSWPRVMFTEGGEPSDHLGYKSNGHTQVQLKWCVVGYLFTQLWLFFCYTGPKSCMCWAVLFLWEAVAWNIETVENSKMDLGKFVSDLNFLSF